MVLKGAWLLAERWEQEMDHELNGLSLPQSNFSKTHFQIVLVKDLTLWMKSVLKSSERLLVEGVHL